MRSPFWISRVDPPATHQEYRGRRVVHRAHADRRPVEGASEAQVRPVDHADEFVFLHAGLDRFHGCLERSVAQPSALPIPNELLFAAAKAHLEHQVPRLDELRLRQRFTEVGPHVVRKAVADPDSRSFRS
jgi:hypothetical protein